MVLPTDKSRTEQAIIALVSVIDAATAPRGYPKPSRNDTLDGILENIGDGDGGMINVLDGNQVQREEVVGADTGVMDNAYEIVQGAQIEVIVKATDPKNRDAMFDQAVLMIHDQIAADRTLGGIVNWCAVDSIERADLAVDGLPFLKGAVISAQLTFVSTRPF